MRGDVPPWGGGPGGAPAQLLASPRERIARRISRREHIHEPAHDACERAALLTRVGAKPAEGPGADAAKAALAMVAPSAVRGSAT